MITGHGGDTVNAYQALPAGAGPFPGVLVIHHLPGWDSSTKEITRTFASQGYNAICPNLYAREGLDTDPDDAAAAARAKGGIPDEQLLGDVECRHYGAARAAHVQWQGRRHRVLLGWPPVLPHRSVPAGRCGGRLLRGVRDRGHSRRVPAQGGDAGRSTRPSLGCPLLGLFGADDQFPSPEQVAELEQALVAHGKTYEFHRYEGAGHAFFSPNRTSFRPEAALDGWQRIFTWFGDHLTTEA